MRALSIMAAMSPLMPLSAIAADSPIYVWGYGGVLEQVFLGISQLLDADGFYAGMITIVFTIGFIFTVFKVMGMGGRPADPTELLKFPVTAMILSHLFLVNYNGGYRIVDETTDYESIQPIALPLAVGESFYIFSNIQRSVLMAMDAILSTPNSYTFRSAGLGFGPSLHDQISSAMPLDNRIFRNFNSYINDCVTNEMERDPLFADRIFASSSLLDDLLVDTNYLISYENKDGKREVIYCKDAWANMKGEITAEGGKFLTNLAQTMGFGENSVSGGFESRVNAVAKAYFGMSASADEYISQSMLANMYSQSNQVTAALSGIDLSALAFMKPYAERKLDAQFYTSGLLAKDYLPILQMVMTVIVVCVSWILALLAIATTNPQYIRTFFWLLLTLALWNVIAAVFNFIFDIQIEQTLEVGYNAHTTGYTFDVKSAIDETIGRKLNILGYLCWLIPILAFALAKGSDVAFANMFSSVGHSFSGAAGSASGAASDRSAPGGHSLFSNLGVTYTNPNASINYAHGGRTYSDRTNVNGVMTDRIHSGMEDGRETWTHKNAFMSYSVTDGKIGEVHLAGIRASDMNAITAQEQESYNKSLSNLANKVAKHIYSSGTSGGTDKSETYKNQFDEAFKEDFINNLKNTFSKTHTQEFVDQITNEAKAGFKAGGFGASVEYSLGYVNGEATKNGSSTQQAQENMNRVTESMNLTISHMTNKGTKLGKMVGDMKSDEISNALNEVKTAQHNLSIAQSNSNAVGVETLKAYAQALYDRGGSDLADTGLTELGKETNAGTIRAIIENEIGRNSIYGQTAEAIAAGQGGIGLPSNFGVATRQATTKIAELDKSISETKETNVDTEQAQTNKMEATPKYGGNNPAQQKLERGPTKHNAILTFAADAKDTIRSLETGKDLVEKATKIAGEALNVDNSKDNGVTPLNLTRGN